MKAAIKIYSGKKLLVIAYVQKGGRPNVLGQALADVLLKYSVGYEEQYSVEIIKSFATLIVANDKGVDYVYSVIVDEGDLAIKVQYNKQTLIAPVKEYNGTEVDILLNPPQKKASPVKPKPKKVAKKIVKKTTKKAAKKTKPKKAAKKSTKGKKK